MEGEAKSLAGSLANPHVAVCPSVGMGHLGPFLTLSTTLASAPYHCTVSLVIIVPLVTTAESNEISSFFSCHPHIRRLDFHVDASSPTPDNVDPFFFRYGTVSRSAHLLASRLSTLFPPIAAAFSDLFFTKGFNTTTTTDDHPFKNYTLITTSARFFSIIAYLPHLLESPPTPGQPAELPGLDPIAADNIPPPDHVYISLVRLQAQYLHLSQGILVNTFESLEPETLSAFKSGRALPNLLPPVLPVGPLDAVFEEEEIRQDPLMVWLDESVMYVSFGNRTALSRDQMRELGTGLGRSGYGFVWVVKTSMIDKEEKEELREMLGEELKEELSKKGQVVMRWVSQKEILGHKAVGGFLSHCGWNSVTEAARYGVPVLAWPQQGEQRENAGVVEKAGFGVWDRDWDQGKLVGGAEIAEKVELLMGNPGFRNRATQVGEQVEKSCAGGGGGTSKLPLITIIRELNQT